MHILMTRPYLEGGGATSSLLNLAGGLVKRGNAVHIATSGGLWLSRARTLGLPVHQTVLAPSTPLHLFLAARQIKQLVHEHHIDLIHSHHRFANLAARLAVRGLSVPLVTTVHEYTRNFHQLTRWSLGDEIITFSKALKGHLMDHYEVPAEKISVVTMGVAQFGVAQFGKLSNIKRPSIGCIARLSPEKGVDILLQALAHIIRTTPHRPHCYILGDGPQLDNLKAQANKLNINNFVKFTGWQENIKNFIVQCDCLVLPSYHEGFGLVVLEGWLEERPTIGSQVGGIAELIEDGNNGVLVPPGNFRALAGAILQLLENPELARQMGKRGRLEILPNYTIDKMVNETEQIYTRLLEP